MHSNVKSSAWLIAHYISTLLISFISLKLNFESFGSEVFAVWVILSSVFILGNTLDFGLGLSLIKFIAAANATGDYDKVKKLVSNAVVIYLVLGCLLVIAEYIVVRVLYFSNPRIILPHLTATANAILYLLLPLFFLQYLCGYLRSGIEGMGGFAITSKLNIILNLLNFSAAVGVFFFKGTVTHLLCFYTLNSALLLVGFITTIQNNFPALIPNFRYINYRDVLPLFKFSTGLQFSTLLPSFLDPTIKYFIGAKIDLPTVTYYEIARRLSTSVGGVFTAAGRTFLISASSISNKNDYKSFIFKEVANIARIGLNYSAVALGIGSIFIASLVYWWFGKEMIIVIYLILILPEIFNTYGYSLYVFYYGIGRVTNLIYFQTAYVLLSLGVIIVCMTVFRSSLALLGYTIAGIVNFILMVIFLEPITSINIANLLKTMRFGKLVTLVVLIIMSIILIELRVTHILLIVSGLSVIAALIFINSIRKELLPMITLFIKQTYRDNK